MGVLFDSSQEVHGGVLPAIHVRAGVVPSFLSNQALIEQVVK